MRVLYRDSAGLCTIVGVARTNHTCRMPESVHMRDWDAHREIVCGNTTYVPTTAVEITLGWGELSGPCRVYVPRYEAEMCNGPVDVTVGHTLLVPLASMPPATFASISHRFPAA